MECQNIYWVRYITRDVSTNKGRDDRYPQSREIYPVVG